MRETAKPSSPEVRSSEDVSIPNLAHSTFETSPHYQLILERIFKGKRSSDKPQSTTTDFGPSAEIRIFPITENLQLENLSSVQEKRAIHEFVTKKFSYDIAHYKAGLFKFSDLEKILIKRSLEIKDMAGKHQMHAYYTLMGKELFTHSRLTHSIETMITADRVARFLGLSEEEIQIIRLQALFHDIGHPPFSHAGQEGLSRVSAFDHDKLAHRLIKEGSDAYDLQNEFSGDDLTTLREAFSNSVGWILRESGFSSDQVEEISKGLDDTNNEPIHTRRRTIVKEVADRLAYIRRDLLMSSLKPELIENFIHATLHYERTLSLEKGTGDRANNDYLVTSDLKVAAAIPFIREILMQEFSDYPSSNLVKEIVAREIADLVRGKHMNPYEFARLTDRQAIKLFSSEAQTWLTLGVEKFFEPVVAWRLGDFLDHGSKAIEEVGFREALAEMIAEETGIQRSHIFVCQSEDHGKRTKIYTKDAEIGLKPNVIYNPASLYNSFFFVVLAKSTPPAKAQAAKKILQDFMIGYLRSDAKDLSQKLFEMPIDAYLYPDEISDKSDLPKASYVSALS
ncbi:MAG: HD domain-containing protein [Bdellovibrionota bacterium]